MLHICGFHIYKNVWEVSNGDELHRMLVIAKSAIIKERQSCHQVPEKLACIYSLFLRRGGVMQCRK